MKKLLIFMFILGITFVSCKTTKKTASGPFEPATTGQTSPGTKVFTVPQDNPPSGTTAEKPYSTRQEAIKFVQPEEQNQNGYFIIVGSFSSLDNAKTFRQTLTGEGFNPVIVQSETGFYRVTVDSFTSEAAARTRLLQIRQNYPKYADTWLLIKK